MFEIVVALCLIEAPSTCRDVLIPGTIAPDEITCAAALATAKPPALDGLHQKGQPRCAPIGPTAAFDEVAPGLFAHRGHISDAAPGNFGDVSNAGFVVGGTSIAVIDAGGSRQVGESFYRSIRTVSDLPISHLILTHMHPDHVLGATVFRDAGAQIVGHPALERALVDRADAYLGNFGSLIGAEAFIGSGIVPPDITLTDRLTLDLGERSLDLQIWPQSHTSTDLTVLDTQTGTLFTGDLMFHEHAPALDGSLLGWQAVLDDLTQLEATMIVPGHGGPILHWPEAAAPLDAYLDVLAADTRAAVKEGISLGEAVETIAQSQAPNWQLFDLFNPRNATVSFTELEWE